MDEQPKILNNLSETDEFEIVILESKIVDAQRRTELANLKIKFYEEHYAKIDTALTKQVGYVVDASNRFSVELTDDEWGDVYDEVYEKQHCLIRPSHSFMPYSLVRKQPELKEYIPVQGPIECGVQLLTDRSTTRAFEIINEHTSENTHRAHIGDLVYWQAWLSAVGYAFQSPITEQDVVTFIVQHVEGIDNAIDEKLVTQRFKNKLGPHKLATIKRRVASLTIFLDQVKWPNPCRSKEIKQLFYKLTKRYGSSKPAGRAITRDILDDMLDTCKDKLLDLRDKSLLLFAWGSGGRRRAEVSSAEVKDLVKNADGEYVYTIPKSKTDQESKGHPVPIKGRVANALSEWLHVSGISDGSIFRTVKKGGKLGKSLSTTDVYRIVQSRLKKAGYDQTQFGAHGLRSGFVTEAGRRGKPLGDVMQMTTHKNVGTVMRYYQAGNIKNNSAANLAD